MGAASESSFRPFSSCHDIKLQKIQNSFLGSMCVGLSGHSWGSTFMCFLYALGFPTVKMKHSTFKQGIICLRFMLACIYFLSVGNWLHVASGMRPGLLHVVVAVSLEVLRNDLYGVVTHMSWQQLVQWHMYMRTFPQLRWAAMHSCTATIYLPTLY